ncbi:glycosyltransferase family 1 protein [Janthinobacterium sp. 17J80-10]|uniref:glycosyltransferase family 4 protein n=1 Tax=Janthinobacterium sp. 17J80-10 TaxID=2497863 RepID=UPI0010056FDF|nr:glycosyltransferase family 1 protein [Janthinobacterium sp. 17J80-10]QAU35451.1 glycosyltransferase family 1 protein [Janthinobacterium sp. 17J80-10]
MRIVIATDAWAPQVNGVVNTLMATRERLQRLGHEVMVLSAEGFRTFSCPTYPEIRLAYRPNRKAAAAIEAFAPDCIHIATEGPIGLAARAYCLRNGLRFTTSYHTRFPEYIRARFMLPLRLSYRWLRWFHEPASAVMVATPAVMRGLAERGFDNLVLWGRGVDTERFKPALRDHAGIPRPLYLYVGRLAVEKNIEAFLNMELPGSKWVIGDGPQREKLEQRYPAARFLGARTNDKLTPYYNCADVLVFPSTTDTFGLVMLEAMACGVPVAAYPVPGPIDVVEQGITGVLDNDLQRACFEAMSLPREQVRQHALKYSWEASTQQFLRNLRPAVKSRPAAAFPASILQLGDLGDSKIA